MASPGHGMDTAVSIPDVPTVPALLVVKGGYQYGFNKTIRLCCPP